MYSEKVQPHRAASKAVDSCFLNAAHELSSWMKIYSSCAFLSCSLLISWGHHKLYMWVQTKCKMCLIDDHKIMFFDSDIF